MSYLIEDTRSKHFFMPRSQGNRTSCHTRHCNVSKPSEGTHMHRTNCTLVARTGRKLCRESPGTGQVVNFTGKWKYLKTLTAVFLRYRCGCQKLNGKESTRELDQFAVTLPHDAVSFDSDLLEIAGERPWLSECTPPLRHALCLGNAPT